MEPEVQSNIQVIQVKDAKFCLADSEQCLFIEICGPETCLRMPDAVSRGCNTTRLLRRETRKGKIKRRVRYTATTENTAIETAMAEPTEYRPDKGHIHTQLGSMLTTGEITEEEYRLGLVGLDMITG